VVTAPTTHTPRQLRFERIAVLDWLALALAALWLWVTSIPFPDDLLLVMLFLSAVAVVIGWLGRTARLLYRAIRHQQPIRPHMVGVLLIPALALLTFDLVAAGAPKQARFQLSRPALDRAAEQVIRHDPQAPKDGDRVGLYRVRSVQTMPGGMRMGLEGSSQGWGALCGLAYSPSGRPAGLPVPDGQYNWGYGYSYHDHLGGPWYEMCFHW
jgi:hypothetical protein